MCAIWSARNLDFVCVWFVWCGALSRNLVWKTQDWRDNHRCFMRIERERPISEKAESTIFAFYKKTGFPTIANSNQ